MSLKERAKLELDRRAQNKVRKAKGEQPVGTVDMEMRDLGRIDLQRIARGENIKVEEAAARMRDHRAKIEKHNTRASSP